MGRKRATSTASMTGSLQRNVGYITYLRRKIRDLEEETAELSQRLNMLLAHVHENMARNNDLRIFELQVEQQVQLQEGEDLFLTLNFSLEEEIRQLRELLEQEAPAQAEAQPQEGPGGGAAATEDDEAAAEEPKEAEGK